MKNPRCPECRKPVDMRGSGFYFHTDGQGECSLRATLDAVDQYGNYPDDLEEDG